MPKRENKGLGHQGMMDKIKGKAKEMSGKTQKNVGKMSGDREAQLKGKAKEMGGTAQGKAGDVERNVDKNRNR